MTRQHYVAMARTIAYHVQGADDAQRVAIDRLVRDLSYDLKRENPRFDRDRFLTACGLS